MSTFLNKEISLDEIIKSINIEANNKSPANDGLTAEFYKHFSNQLAPVLSDGYDYWGRLGTMVVTYRTGIISATYIKKVKKRYYKLKTHVTYKLRL